MNRSFDGRKGKRSCKEEEVLEQNSATHKNKQSKRDDFEQKEVHQPALDNIDNKLHVEQDDSDVFLLHFFFLLIVSNCFQRAEKIYSLQLINKQNRSRQRLISVYEST
jgi:hypothetical protein